MAGRLRLGGEESDGLGWVLDRSLKKSYYYEGEGEELEKRHCFFG